LKLAAMSVAVAMRLTIRVLEAEAGAKEGAPG